MRSYPLQNGMRLCAVLCAIVISSSCCPPRLTAEHPPFEIPATPVIPSVEFVLPSDKSAVLCVDQENADALATGDDRLKNHIQILENMLDLCR